MIGRIHSLESFGAIDGPGIRFMAFMQGCPMRCEFCHNPDTWDFKAKVQYEWTPEELLQEVNRYKNFIRKGGVTVSGGEPLMQAPFVRAFFRLCQEAGYHTALDTSGAIWSTEATSVLDYTDLVLLDIKTLDDSLHKSYTGHTRTNNQRWLDLLLERKKPVWIRHVVVPERTYDDGRLKAVATHLLPYASIIEQVDLLPYHTLGNFKYQKMGLPYSLEGVKDLSQEEIIHAKDIFRNVLTNRIRVI